MFDHILGNAPLKEVFQRALEKNGLSRTLLFVGEDGIGKSLFAKAIAKALLKNAASLDFHHLFPDNKNGFYSIDPLREMIDQEHQAAFAGGKKVFILEEAERMQAPSANALLKTLEEPSLETTFILLTSHLSQILPTIVSRAMVFHFSPLKEEEIQSFLHQKGLPIRFAKLAEGSIAKALEMAENPLFEEIQTILLECLRAPESYLEISSKLTLIEEKIQSQKDPLKISKSIEHLFRIILMWQRDQHAKDVGIEEKDLFFPDEPKKREVPFKNVEKGIEKVRDSLERNLKLSSCLIDLWLTEFIPNIRNNF